MNKRKKNKKGQPRSTLVPQKNFLSFNFITLQNSAAAFHTVCAYVGGPNILETLGLASLWGGGHGWPLPTRLSSTCVIMPNLEGHAHTHGRPFPLRMNPGYPLARFNFSFGGWIFWSKFLQPDALSGAILQISLAGPYPFLHDYEYWIGRGVAPFFCRSFGASVPPPKKKKKKKNKTFEMIRMIIRLPDMDWSWSMFHCTCNYSARVGAALYWAPL